MFPILYDETSFVYGTIPNHNGLGVLSDSLSCYVEEERNGSYELVLTYPSSGIHAKELLQRRIIKAKPNFTDDPQLFRIYKIDKSIGTSWKIYGRHISYDLCGMPILSGDAKSCISACELLSNEYFNITTDKNVVANFNITEPSSIRSWLGGKSGSLLDVYGTGEYKFNNYQIEFLTHRGLNRGVTVRYGKNLLSLKNEDNSSNLATNIILYYKSSEDGTIIYSSKTPTGLNLEIENTICIDVSSDYEENAPTVEELNNKAIDYLSKNNYLVPKNSIKLNFLQMKNLKDRVDLCDEVTVIYEDYNLNFTVKCIKTTWDVLKEKYTSIELGDPKSNFADTFINSNKTINKVINATASQIQQSITNATELITGNSGGYVVLHDSNKDGEPDEILILNTDSINTATKVWRWNASGLGYSSNGYNGTYGLAMTMDGHIVANYITTGTLSANRVRTGLLKAQTGNNYFDLDSGNAHFDSLEIEIGGTTKDAATAISNAQTTADGKVSPSEIRAKFAADNTSISINSGTISFNSNTFIVNSSNLSIDANGNIKSSSFKSNSSIEFYDSGWSTKYLDIGTRGGSTNWRIPYINLYSQDNHLGVDISAVYQSLGYGMSYGNIILYGTVGNDNSEGDYSANSISLGKINNFPGLNLHAGSLYIPPSESGESPYFSNTGIIEVKGMQNSYTISLYGMTGGISCVSLTQTSSRKNKKNIKDLEINKAKQILNLKPVNFDFKEENLGTNKAGFIAEDVYEYIPEIVTKENGEISGLNYIELIPYLVKVLQIQQKEIDDLKGET